ncbi:MAG: helix-turn-helix domain-containing protein [Oryzomonas sp.]|uniref:helix-turn-helix domain-containing protein n=1 Tax=Oryzomonas sp. TaxID=2855186 RepID=UPI00284A5FA1|nr:helix-turn-helix domain-containing protein [Oryzomonas sp.]MDR3579953.1 helix-turn-helix domain-containing protein [Oryzomonas sp.]
MSLIKNWYTVDEAASRYGISIQQLLGWVENGLVRSEGNKGKVLLINGDDIELKLNLTPSV